MVQLTIYKVGSIECIEILITNMMPSPLVSWIGKKWRTHLSDYSVGDRYMDHAGSGVYEREKAKHVEPVQYDSVNDSGARESFSTGSVRDTRAGKGRFDLIPVGPLKRLAKHYENGANKYGDHNWELGQPSSRYYDSAMRHLISYMAGDRSEDHPAAIAWNAFAIAWNEEHRPDLDDITKKE
jgi:hypothetical protein